MIHHIHPYFWYVYQAGSMFWVVFIPYFMVIFGDDPSYPSIFLVCLPGRVHVLSGVYPIFYGDFWRWSIISIHIFGMFTRPGPCFEWCLSHILWWFLEMIHHIHPYFWYVYQAGSMFWVVFIPYFMVIFGDDPSYPSIFLVCLPGRVHVLSGVYPIFYGDFWRWSIISIHIFGMFTRPGPCFEWCLSHILWWFLEMIHPCHYSRAVTGSRRFPLRGLRLRPPSRFRATRSPIRRRRAFNDPMFGSAREEMVQEKWWISPKTPWWISALSPRNIWWICHIGHVYIYIWLI